MNSPVARESSKLLPVLRLGASLAALAVAAGFAGAILAVRQPSIVLHEIAGLLLLVLVGSALTVSIKLRHSEPRPVSRLAGALGALIAVGFAGALLAIGDLPGALDGLPLVGLVVLSIFLVDSIRVSGGR